MAGEVGFHFGNNLGVVRALFIEPEYGRSIAQTSAFYRKFNPILNCRIFSLASAPNITGSNGVLKKRFAAVIDYPDGARSGDFKSLVMRTIFFGCLCHQTDVGHAADRFGIECAVSLAEIQRGLVHTGITAIRNEREGVLKFALCVVNFSARANHRWHRSIDDDVARHVQVGDALIRIDVGQARAVGVSNLDVGFNGSLLVSWQRLNFCHQIAESVVEINPQPGEGRAVFGKQLFEKYPHCVAENDWVRDLHHGGLKVQRQQYAVSFGLSDLFFVIGDERLFAQYGHIEYFTDLERSFIFEHLNRAIGFHQLNTQGGRSNRRKGFFVAEEIAVAHRHDASFRGWRKGQISVRMRARVGFDRFRCATIGIALTQHGVYRRSQYFRIT